MSDAPTRLLAVCATGHPGGAEIGLLRLLDRLDPARWRIDVSTPQAGPLADAVASRGWDPHQLPLGPLVGGGAGSLRAIGSWPALRGLARQADVVYLNGGVCGRLLPALAGPGRRPRRVLHVHDVVERVPRIWSLADVVLVPSGAAATPLAGLNPHVVHCPVDPDPPAVAPPWPPGPGPVVAFVGRIEPRKGPLDLVAAAPAIRALVPGVRVMIVGDDPYGGDPDYRAQVRMGDVEHYGWVTNGAGLMRHLDVLVCPSRQEPFATVALEAMAVGTPVVASRVGGFPEMLQDGVDGLLVPPGEPQALAAAVARAISSRQTMGAAARRSAERFHADAYARRVQLLIAPPRTR
jgi:glycosyltransferase involved in cell wall biosynthesis